MGSLGTHFGLDSREHGDDLGDLFVFQFEDLALSLGTGVPREIITITSVIIIKINTEKPRSS